MPRLELSRLQRAARSTGYPTVVIPNAGTRGSSSFGPRNVLWHHTAGPWTPGSRDYPSLAVVRDGRPGIPGPLAGAGIGYSGTIYIFATGRANHAGRGSYEGYSGNYDLFGIEVESPGDGRYTKAQLDCIPKFRDALAKEFGWAADKQFHHREWAPSRKIDPKGINVRSMTYLGAVPAPAKPTHDGPMTVLRKGSKGYRVAEAQGLLAWRGHGLKVDSDFGGATETAVRNFQKDNGLTVDGVVGPNTWAPLRNKAKLPLGESRNLGSFVVAPTVLKPGDKLSHGDMQLQLQGDGNLVIAKAGKPTWGSVVRMDELSVQRDGRLVGRTKGQPVWTAGPVGQNPKEVKLHLQLSGQAVMYADGKPVWSAG